MPKLEFLGRGDVYAHHLGVEYRELEVDEGKSLPQKGKPPSLDDNLIIHGDNLSALKALMPRYAGKVNCIYIDPPYNTGNEQWQYNDRVNSPLMKSWLGKAVGSDDLARHEKWLCMMWPRLNLLKDLLADDGVIFVSIDDNEVGHLRLIMDEIFGEGGESIIWKKSDEGRYGKMKQTRTVRNDHDFILVGFKNKNDVVFSKIFDFPNFSSKPKKDEKGYWWSGYIARGKRGSNPDHARYYTVQAPGKKPFTAQFEVDKGKFEKLDKDGYIHWSKEGIPYRKIYNHEKREVVCSSVLLDLGGTYQGRLNFEEVLGRQNDKSFPNPKPTDLIKRLLFLVTRKAKDSLILDSFAGSGTTAQAVLELNKEDGGNRRFILVECEDYAYKITAERVGRVIEGVEEAKDENLKKGLGGSFTYCELGREISINAMLRGENMPDYEELARHIFWTATGETLDKKLKKKKNGFIGETERYRVYLLYEADVEKLKKLAFTHDNAAEICKTDKSKKKKLVFAPVSHIEEKALRDVGIIFCQLPWAIHQRMAYGA